MCLLMELLGVPISEGTQIFVEWEMKGLGGTHLSNIKIVPTDLGAPEGQEEWTPCLPGLEPWKKSWSSFHIDKYGDHWYLVDLQVERLHEGAPPHMVKEEWRFIKMTNL